MGVKSIFKKIVIPMAAVVCLLGVAILGIVGKLFTGTYEQQIYEQNQNTASFVAQSVGSFMNMAYRITEQLANSNDILSMDTELQTPVLEDTAKRNDYFELIYIQDMNGDQTGRSSGELGNRANRWWFIQMLETGKAFVSKSYYSVNTNKACASIFIPLKREGEEIGILATDIMLDKLQEAVAEFSDLDAGKISFIIDGEGVVVAHPEKMYYEELYNYKNMTRTVTKKDKNDRVLYDDEGNIVTEELSIEVSPEYADMLQKVMKGQSGQGQITDSGREYYASYAPIEMDGASDSWSVITLQEKSAAMQLMNRILRAGVFVTVIGVIVAVLIILALTKSITKPIQYCLERLTGLSKGDLSTEVTRIKGRDETAQLLNALQEMIQTLKKIIGDITAQLERLADGDVTRRQLCYEYSGDFNKLGKSLEKISVSLNQSVRQVGLHSGMVFDNANVLSGTAQSLADNTMRQAGAVEELMGAVEDMSSQINTSAQAAHQVKERMEQVNGDMMCSYQSINEMLKAMDKIYEDSLRINEITKTVQEISSKTNLLSLNAAVEAARAGETGRGFSVIAGEIRELAHLCGKAAENTSELVGTALNEIRQGVEMLQTTAQTIVRSADDIRNMNELTENISEASEQQVNSIGQVSAALKQISDAVQNNSATAQESASTSVQMQEHALKLKQAVQIYRY